MVFDISEVKGIGEFSTRREKERELYMRGEKVFLVTHSNTIEVRTDGKLAKLLSEEYESVMQSRYFGRGGIEIVLEGQLSVDELNDLVRLSYNLSEK